MHVLCVAINAYIKIVTVFHFHFALKNPRKLWHTDAFGRFSPILISAILAPADKCPQEKKSVRKRLIVMFPRHDKKSEPVQTMGLGTERGTDRH